MSTPLMNSLLLLAVGLSVFAIVMTLRRHFGDLATVDPAPWSSTLSYVATAYGVVVGFWPYAINLGRRGRMLVVG